MPKIRHLAIRTKDPERLAKFYERGVRHESASIREERRHLYERRLPHARDPANRGDSSPSGINHFGFQVDDIADVEAKLAKWNEPMTERPSTRPFAEHRAMDPDGNLFDISVHGYDDVEYAADRQMKAKKEKQPA